MSSLGSDNKPRKRLLAWQRRMDLYVEIHRLPATFPANERYLVSQIRSAALAAPSKIAKGAADHSRDQFRQFLGYSLRSMKKVETQLEAARRVGLVADLEAGRITAILDEGLLTYGLKRSL